MRVGLLADRLDRNGRHTGVGSYIEGLARGIEEIEPKGEYVVFSWGGTGGGAPRSGVVERRMLPWPRKATAASWTFLGLPKVRDVGGRLDLLHVLVPTVPVPSKAPLVATIHDLMPLKHPQFFGRRHRTLFARAITRIRSDAKWIIAPSLATKGDIVELLGFPEDRVAVTHWGVPLQFSRASETSQRAARVRLAVADAPLVLFVGEISERKNVHRLIEAFALTHRRVPEARMLLAGSLRLGHERVARTIEENRLSHAVRVLGHVDQPTLDALVATAAVLALPSLDEGFGFPALEAMSVGTAVVASSGASLPEIVGDAGIFVDPTDTEALADGIARVLQDDVLRATLGRHGESRAAHFTWAATARQTVEIYEQVLTT